MEVYRIDTREAWDSAKAIRQRVFVEEQNCPPEEEWDEHDWPGGSAVHLLGSIGQTPVATARWRIADFDGRPAAKLERFAVLPEHRGRGLGRQMIAAAIDDAVSAGHTRLVLHAQAHLEALYASFGFERRGDEFEEAGIPHVTMVRTHVAPLARSPSD